MTKDVKTLCPYCGVGCGLIATTDGTTVLRLAVIRSTLPTWAGSAPKAGHRPDD